jgi:hypothetical protein
MAEVWERARGRYLRFLEPLLFLELLLLFLEPLLLEREDELELLDLDPELDERERVVELDDELLVELRGRVVVLPDEVEEREPLELLDELPE